MAFRQKHYAAAAWRHCVILGCSLPPRTFEGAVGAVGLDERVELGHVLAGQGEVENLRVLADSLPVGRFGAHRNTVPRAPAQSHLRGCPPRSPPDPPPRPVVTSP